MTNLQDRRMLPDPWPSACQADLYPTELPGLTHTEICPKNAQCRTWSEVVRSTSNAVLTICPDISVWKPRIIMVTKWCLVDLSVPKKMENLSYRIVYCLFNIKDLLKFLHSMPSGTMFCSNWSSSALFAMSPCIGGAGVAQWLAC